MFFDPGRMGSCGYCHEVAGRGAPVSLALQELRAARLDLNLVQTPGVVTARPAGEEPFPALVAEKSATDTRADRKRLLHPSRRPLAQEMPVSKNCTRPVHFRTLQFSRIYATTRPWPTVCCISFPGLWTAPNSTISFSRLIPKTNGSITTARKTTEKLWNRARKSSRCSSRMIGKSARRLH